MLSAQAEAVHTGLAATTETISTLRDQLSRPFQGPQQGGASYHGSAAAAANALPTLEIASSMLRKRDPAVIPILSPMLNNICQYLQDAAVATADPQHSLIVTRAVEVLFVATKFYGISADDFNALLHAYTSFLARFIPEAGLYGTSEMHYLFTMAVCNALNVWCELLYSDGEHISRLTSSIRIDSVYAAINAAFQEIARRHVGEDTRSVVRGHLSLVAMCLGVFMHRRQPENEAAKDVLLAAICPVAQASSLLPSCSGVCAFKAARTLMPTKSIVGVFPRLHLTELWHNVACYILQSMLIVIKRACDLDRTTHEASMTTTPNQVMGTTHMYAQSIGDPTGTNSKAGYVATRCSNVMTNMLRLCALVMEDHAATVSAPVSGMCLRSDLPLVRRFLDKNVLTHIQECCDAGHGATDHYVTKTMTAYLRVLRAMIRDEESAFTIAQFLDTQVECPELKLGAVLNFVLEHCSKEHTPETDPTYKNKKKSHPAAVFCAQALSTFESILTFQSTRIRSVLQRHNVVDTSLSLVAAIGTTPDIMHAVFCLLGAAARDTTAACSIWKGIDELQVLRTRYHQQQQQQTPHQHHPHMMDINDTSSSIVGTTDIVRELERESREGRFPQMTGFLSLVYLMTNSTRAVRLNMSSGVPPLRPYIDFVLECMTMCSNAQRQGSSNSNALQQHQQQYTQSPQAMFTSPSPIHSHSPLVMHHPQYHYQQQQQPVPASVIAVDDRWNIIALGCSILTSCAAECPLSDATVDSLVCTLVDIVAKSNGALDREPYGSTRESTLCPILDFLHDVAFMEEAESHSHSRISQRMGHNTDFIIALAKCVGSPNNHVSFSAVQFLHQLVKKTNTRKIGEIWHMFNEERNVRCTFTAKLQEDNNPHISRLLEGPNPHVLALWKQHGRSFSDMCASVKAAILRLIIHEIPSPVPSVATVLCGYPTSPSEDLLPNSCLEVIMQRLHSEDFAVKEPVLHALCLEATFRLISSESTSTPQLRRLIEGRGTRIILDLISMREQLNPTQLGWLLHIAAAEIGAETITPRSLPQLPYWLEGAVATLRPVQVPSVFGEQPVPNFLGIAEYDLDSIKLRIPLDATMDERAQIMEAFTEANKTLRQQHAVAVMTNGWSLALKITCAQDTHREEPSQQVAHGYAQAILSIFRILPEVRRMMHIPALCDNMTCALTDAACGLMAALTDDVDTAKEAVRTNEEAVQLAQGVCNAVIHLVRVPGAFADTLSMFLRFLEVPLAHSQANVIRQHLEPIMSACRSEMQTHDAMLSELCLSVMCALVDHELLGADSVQVLTASLGEYASAITIIDEHISNLITAVSKDPHVPYILVLERFIGLLAGIARFGPHIVRVITNLNVLQALESTNFMRILSQNSAFASGRRRDIDVQAVCAVLSPIFDFFCGMMESALEDDYDLLRQLGQCMVTVGPTVCGILDTFMHDATKGALGRDTYTLRCTEAITRVFAHFSRSTMDMSVFEAIGLFKFDELFSAVAAPNQWPLSSSSSSGASYDRPGGAMTSIVVYHEDGTTSMPSVAGAAEHHHHHHSHTSHNSNNNNNNNASVAISHTHGLLSETLRNVCTIFARSTAGGRGPTSSPEMRALASRVIEALPKLIDAMPDRGSDDAAAHHHPSLHPFMFSPIEESVMLCFGLLLEVDVCAQSTIETLCDRAIQRCPEARLFYSVKQTITGKAADIGK